MNKSLNERDSKFDKTSNPNGDESQMQKTSLTGQKAEEENMESAIKNIFEYQPKALQMNVKGQSIVYEDYKQRMKA